MEEIYHLIHYYTGQQSKQKKRIANKVFKDEMEEDEIESKNKYEKIIKKIPKNLRVYVKVRFQA
jgi:hypothetical protein